MLILVCSIPVLHAQIASYNFDSDVKDQVGDFDATVFGTPIFENEQYISFSDGEYLTLPLSLSESIDISESWQIQFRFKVEGDWQATAEEEARVIVANKVFDQRFGGYEISAREWEGQLQLMATYGDGIQYEPGACVSCCPDCRLSEGKIDWVFDIDSDIWYDVKIKFLLNTDKPYIQYEVDGTVITSFFNLLDPKADPEGFRQTINNQQVWVGTDENNDFFQFNDQPKLGLQIDYLSFSSPIPPGDATVLGNALSQLVDEMNGELNLTDEEIDVLRKDFVDNWSDDSYRENEEIIWTYINVYAEYHEPIFNNWENAERSHDFTPKEAIQFILEQWILDNRYGPETVLEMDGLAFEDHEIFPGRVSGEAPRLYDTKFMINGSYHTNPGFLLNGQERVIRPTGYYVPPGELVTIAIPDDVIGQGLNLFVGAHNVDLSVTWSQFRRFPRIMTTYELNTKSLTVANPFGGGIYITVPDGSDFGNLEFEVDGAIKAPYYSTVEGFETSLEEFQNDVSDQFVPWTDIESDNMMATIPQGIASAIVDIDSALTIWHESFDGVNVALGRPLERFRAEYFLIDRQNHSAYTAIPAGYPMSFEDYVAPYGADQTMPFIVGRGRDWYRNDQSLFYAIILHEQGHLHNMPTMFAEQESNVNLLAAAAISHAMGETIDSAFVYSLGQKLNLDQAALDWMLVDNFYLGNRIGYRVDEQRDSGDEQQYQHRGYAKYVDIANLFGWEALGSIMSPFYEIRRNDPQWSPYDVPDDEYIETASNALGFNMAPHFEFWGIIPSDELVEQLGNMPTSDVIKDRLIHFQSIIPANNEEFLPLYNIMSRKLGSPERYEGWKDSYDEAFAQKVSDRVDQILNKYYNISPLDYNQNPEITGVSDILYIQQNSSRTLFLGDFLVEDRDNDYPTDFSLSVSDGNNYVVLGTTITPDTDFLGELKVSVMVNDGQEDSEPYEATVVVVLNNDRPVIDGLASALTTGEDEILTLKMSDFIVTDNDHSYPNDFTLKLQKGPNYTLSENVLIPALDYYGAIEVPVIVNDGIQDSEVFLAEISITEINDAPVVIGPARLVVVNEDESINLGSDDFIVRDVDHEPGQYSIDFLEGEGYTLSDTGIMPIKDFFGQMIVKLLAVDWGGLESSIYELKVEVLPINDKPIIAGLEEELYTDVDKSITLGLSDFIIDDPDNETQDDFTLVVSQGDNFTFSGLVITPSTDFIGDLLVPVTVNDGELNSEIYLAKVSVSPPNVVPVITGTTSSLVTDEDTPLTISLSHLSIADSNHTYPDDFSMKVYAGDNYSFLGTQITPDTNFFGELTVPVSVNDGIDESEVYDVKLQVESVNDLPEITAFVTEFTVNEDESFDLRLEDFQVDDPDHTYPDDFNLIVLDGDDYSVSQLSVSPAQDFFGDLSIEVKVNDGEGDSRSFEFEIEILPVNDIPVIIGTNTDLTTEMDEPLMLNPSDFIINDPDHKYPDDFTLTVLSGDDYTVNGHEIKPNPEFIGQLVVPIVVNDGIDSSEPFDAIVTVSHILSIEDSFIQEYFSIYPNPVSDIINIETNVIESYSVRIVSLRGEVLFQSATTSESSMTISLADVKDGLYLLQINSAKGMGSIKLIKQ